MSIGGFFRQFFCVSKQETVLDLENGNGDGDGDGDGNASSEWTCRCSLY